MKFIGKFPSEIVGIRFANDVDDPYVCMSAYITNGHFSVSILRPAVPGVVQFW